MRSGGSSFSYLLRINWSNWHIFAV